MMLRLKNFLGLFLAIIMISGIVAPAGFVSAKADSSANNIPASWDFTKVSKERLLAGWTIKNENANAWSLTDSGLVFTGCSGDLTAAGVNLGVYQNMFYTSNEGNYIADTKIEFSDNIAGDGGKSADLIIYQDDQNFLKFACQKSNGGRAYLQSITNGVQDFEYAKAYSGTSVYLRIKKIEDTYSFYYSADGITYTKLGVDVIRGYNAPKIALLVARNQDNPITFTYKYLKFTELVQKSWDFTNTTKAELESGWAVKNENASAWSLSQNGLSFTNCSGNLAPNETNYQNLFYTQAPDGDYIADTKVDFNKTIIGSGGTSAGIFVWQDDENFLKLVAQRANNGRAYLQSVTNGAQDFEYDDGVRNYAELSMWLRIKKVGNVYSFYFSKDGITYTKIGKDATRDYAAPKIALGVVKNTTDPITYTFKHLNFSDIMPQSWDFTKTTEAQLKAGWTIKNENTSAWNISDNGLTFTSCSGDLTTSQHAASMGACQNLFCQSGEGNYIADTKIEFSEDIYGSGGKSVGLVIYQDDSNFLKLACQRVNNGRVYLQGVAEGVQDFEYANAYVGTCVYLRIKKNENTYSFYYSADGKNYTKLGADVTREYAAPKVALLVARNNTDPIYDFTYKYLNFSDVDSDKITLNIETLRLKAGETFKLAAVLSKSGDVVTYTSNDADVASVSADGLLTAKAEGYALIKVTNSFGGLQTVAVSVAPTESIVSTHQGNPYLPLWEFVPDGEPYIFEDPDNAGKYRVYVYGSHDHRGNDKWCGVNHVVWSAPVDDLSAWRYDGIIFESSVDGDTTQMNAPDIVEIKNTDGTKFYCLYPNSIGNPSVNSVAFSDRPDGPFRVKPGNSGVVYGDPAVFADDDGRVYAYWGSEAGSKCAELDPNTMCTVKEGTSIKANLPGIAACKSEDFDASQYNIVIDGNERKFRFFEASSMRKVGNKYVMIWARAGENEELGGSRQNLAYGYSDSPLGPWKYGGNIVSAGGEAILNANGSYNATFMSTNIHGSICEINGNWYIFYHRGLHGIKPRQAMVEPVSVEWSEASVADGGYVRISHVESTSNGFSVNGLDPYREHSAGIVSYLSGFGANDYPFSADYSREVTSLPIRNIKNGVVAGIKYFNFDEEVDSKNKTMLNLKLCPKGTDATIDVYARPTSAVNTPVTKENGVITSVGEGSFKVGSLELTSDMAQVMTEFEIDVSKVNDLDGKWGLFFVFSSSSADAICDFDTLKFVSVIPVEISSVESSENAVNGVNIINNIALPEGTALYIAVYDECDKTLKNVTSVVLDETNRQKGTKSIVLPKALSFESGDTIKAFVWDGKLTPLTDVY